jgi:predicted dienelactone hydrolase
MTFGLRVLASLLVAGFAFAPQVHAIDSIQKCLKISGSLGVKCMVKGTKLLAEQIEPAAGQLINITFSNLSKIFSTCQLTDARALGYRDSIDIDTQITDGCNLFAYEMNATVFNTSQGGLSEDQQKCRSEMYKRMTKVQKTVTIAVGKKCSLKEQFDKGCDRAKRDAKVAKTRAKAEASLLKKCGTDFDVVNLYEGGTLEERIANFVDYSVIRGRHWALRIYPPSTAEPTGELGVFKVGLKTLELEDASRLNVAGDGPRPVVTEVYYPVDAADTVGVPEEEASILGIPLFDIPAFRDVPLAAGGPRPIVLFSHGNEGTRIQSFFFGSVLASHGFIVISPDHHGNTLTEAEDDPDSATNRPLDMSFLIDEATFMNSDSGNFFENAFDLANIGMSGHSFGGYTSFALAGGTFALGTFTDTRIDSIFPQAPASSATFFDPSFFAAITVPTMIVGGTLDETTPFDTHQQYAFDNMVSGASVVGLVTHNNAGHFTYSSFCEVPPALLGFVGGFEEGCEPRHLPWRYAQDLTMYLAQNFFDWTLRGNATALANLNPALIGQLDSTDMTYQSK